MLPKTVLLNAVTKTGGGPIFPTGGPVAKFGLQVIHTGAPSVVKVTLRGSLTGNPEQVFVIGTWDSGAGQASGDIIFAIDKPVIFVEGFLETLTGGTNPTVTAIAVGL